MYPPLPATVTDLITLPTGCPAHIKQCAEPNRECTKQYTLHHHCQQPPADVVTMLTDCPIHINEALSPTESAQAALPPPTPPLPATGTRSSHLADRLSSSAEPNRECTGSIPTPLPATPPKFPFSHHADGLSSTQPRSQTNAPQPPSSKLPNTKHAIDTGIFRAVFPAQPHNTCT